MSTLGTRVPERAAWTPERLVARAAIEDLHSTFGQALDSNDWPLYRSCLDDELHVDYSQSAGLPVVTTTADRWTSFVAECVEPQLTVHYYTNLRVRLTGDGQAVVRLNHQSHHRVETRNGDAVNVQFGTYDTQVVERRGLWLLSSITHRTSWVTGNPALIDTSRPSWIAAHAAVFGTA